LPNGDRSASLKTAGSDSPSAFSIGAFISYALVQAKHYRYLPAELMAQPAASRAWGWRGDL